MKRKLVILILLLIIVCVVVFAFLQLRRPSFDNVYQELDHLVASQVEKDQHIRNCVLAIEQGDGSFSWSGAAGIAYQDGQSPMTADTPIYLASITKLYTAAAVMRLYEEGQLALDDPMADYLPDDLIQGIHTYQGTDYSHHITIEQLLSHTSGIADYYSEQAGDGSTLYQVFVSHPERIWTIEEVIGRVRNDMQPNFEPGADASYSDTNFQLLGLIIEQVTGKPLQVVYDEYFFQPLDLQHTWLVGLSQPQDPSTPAPADVFAGDEDITRIRSNGAYWADGGIVSTPAEAIIFLKALNGGQVIRKDTLELMHDWHPLQDLPLQYGYGTMDFQIPAPFVKMSGLSHLWGHSGSTGSFLYYSEDFDLYLAGTIDQTEDQVSPFILMIKAITAIQ